MVSVAKRRIGIVAGLVLVSALAPSLQARAEDPLWTILKEGKQVVLIRHAATTPGAGDPAGMRLEDCSTQRNLSDEGREQARRLGAAFQAHGIAVDRVLSSPWCRCLDTARLAFGKAEVSRSLGNLFGRAENRDKQVREMRARASDWRGPGNLVMLSHGVTIYALTGMSPEPAEMVVLTPRGNGRFDVAGSVRLGM